MIKSLHISNYALIDRVDIELTSGLNIITGETGAGKSIILGALSMLLGERGDSRVVTDQEKKSIIEAVIDLKNDDSLVKIFEELEIDIDPEKIYILRREIAVNGRSRAFINDTPVNISQLSFVARQLIDIHSQHQNLLLADPEFQLRIIDALTGDNEIFKNYSLLFQEYRSALKQYAVAKRDFEKNQNEEEVLRFELDRINNLQLIPDEQEVLENEKRFLSNFMDIKSSLSIILNKLTNDEINMLESSRLINSEFEGIKSLIKDGENISERLTSIFLEIKDLSSDFEEMDSHLAGDPERLSEVEERLSEIYRLEKKYNVESSNDLLKIANGIKKKLYSIENGENDIKELQEKAKKLRSKALEVAKVISQKRKDTAHQFIKELEKRAVTLGMKNIRAQVDFTYTNDLMPDGIDEIDFRFAFNKNQEPISVGKTASGGEISRLMLCIKSIVANKMQFPTIIFDEIDTGVSGEIAAKMGEMMLEVADGIQVLAITHLPQVAAKGNSHFKVFKEDDEHNTHTHLIKLDEEERVKELAVMMSGDKVNDAAIANARYLLGNNQKHG